jgi:plastocyanin domain-containing protein
MNKKYISFLIICSGIAISLLIFAFSNKNETIESHDKDNVKIENGIQEINIDTRLGYKPLKTKAKSGIPTKINFQTDSTFDCSLALRIPDIKYAKNLKPTGTESVDLGTSTAGKLYGTCSMGMYYFEIDFE